MKVEITIPSELEERVKTALCTLYSYQEKVPSEDGKSEVTNPQTKEEFITEKFAEKIRSFVKRYESDQARKAKEDAIADELDAIA